MFMEQQNKIPRELLTCKICSMIFFKPITLTCGHTFCRQCLQKQISPKDQNIVEYRQEKIKQKLSTCSICYNIIWKKVSDMQENRIIQNLISKFYNQQIVSRKTQQTNPVNNQREAQNLQSSQFYNKIILRIKQPEIIPMPYCYFQIQFSTPFIDDVVGQSNSLILTWDSIYGQKLGLLCQMLKVQPINNSTFSLIVYNQQQSQKVLQLKYKGKFLGTNFVLIQDIGKISVNLRHKIIVLGESVIDKVMKDLEICNCSVFHSKNYKQVQYEQFNLFFNIYDRKMNEPHLVKQIRSKIFDGPFQSRNNTEAMIYCVLRILKMPQQMKKTIILSFDDKQRIQKINHWILSQNQRTQSILDIKIPGNYQSNVVFFIVFLFLALNLFKTYNKNEEFI